MADYRSTRVYGWSPEMDFGDESRRREQFHNDYLDVIGGVDAVVDMGVADPERVFLIGHSFGSMIANYALTQTDRFDAVITKEGAWFDMWDEDLPQATTPTLVVSSGPPDTRQGLQGLAERLQALGVEAEYVNYPDDEHSLIHSANQRDLLQRAAAWIDRYVR